MLRTQHLRRLRAVEGGDVATCAAVNSAAAAPVGVASTGAGIGERNRTLEDSGGAGGKKLVREECQSPDLVRGLHNLRWQQ